MKNIDGKEILEVGDILAAKYTYGWECLLWEFFRVVRTTPSMVEIEQLKGKTVYDDGKTGPHYYDDPRHYDLVRDAEGNPVVDTNGIHGKRKVKYTKSGVPVVKPEDFYCSRGIWDGKPLESYNYH